MSYQTIEEGMKGKTAIISGGTMGIGKACVETFCAAGVNVVTMGRSVDKGKAVAEKINTWGKGKCVFYECDVRNYDRIGEIVELTVKEFGKLDVLVNCAGYFPLQQPIDMITLEMYQDVINTNLTAYFMGCKYALPYLRTTKGAIINIGSVLGTTGDEGSLAYTCTKGAIHTFTRSLAVDEGRNGVRVNEVKPGHICNEMFELTTSRQADPEGFVKYSDSLQWLGRGGTSEEVAYAVLFLASPWASFITGTELHVTGGFEIGEGPKLPNPYLAWGKMEMK
ncbi:MAG: SDR family oxidoreductase [Treponema sp.]|jgi:NAD(P)-dependent dehydrogenase (short-subunit alcohol dehydrogenase family)|nr:SDR family oxidoreductase [Treponema sp.]